ncbi:MAG: hypothetical protein ACXVGQ_00315 [Mycobacteriaceae bacterium]
MLSKLLTSLPDLLILLGLIVATFATFLLAGLAWGLLVLGVALLLVGLVLSLAGVSWRS